MLLLNRFISRAYGLSQSYLLFLRLSSTQDIPPSTFYHKDLIIKKSKYVTQKPVFEGVFGTITTDHMFEADYNDKEGWSKPIISPFHNFSFNPLNSTFHYGLSAFEGAKAYYDINGKIRLFRFRENLKRMNRSSINLCMPTFDIEEGYKCISDLIKLDKNWVPQMEDSALYIRPTIMSLTDELGVHRADSVKFFCVLSPVLPYFKGISRLLNIKVISEGIRAWPKGYGYLKLSANYAPALKLQDEAHHEGYDQVLWLTEGKYISELGGMNIFFLIKDKVTGKLELTTPALDGTILICITRDSILSLAPTVDKNIIVTERKITLEEIKEAARSQRLLEAFACGTAAIITEIGSFDYKGEKIRTMSTEETRKNNLTTKLLTKLKNIQYGKDSFEDWSEVIS